MYTHKGLARFICYLAAGFVVGVSLQAISHAVVGVDATPRAITGNAASGTVLKAHWGYSDQDGNQLVSAVVNGTANDPHDLSMTLLPPQASDAAEAWAKRSIKIESVGMQPGDVEIRAWGAADARVWVRAQGSLSIPHPQGWKYKAKGNATFDVDHGFGYSTWSGQLSKQYLTGQRGNSDTLETLILSDPNDGALPRVFGTETQGFLTSFDYKVTADGELESFYPDIVAVGAFADIHISGFYLEAWDISSQPPVYAQKSDGSPAVWVMP